MDPFLTRKAKMKNVVRWVLLPLEVLFLFAFLSVLRDDIRSGDSTEAVICIIFIVVLVVVLIRTVRIHLTKRRAREYAMALSRITELQISFDDLDLAMQKTNVQKELKKLIDGGYLQNVTLDFLEHKMLLFPVTDAARARMEQKARKKNVRIVCSHCGAESIIAKGSVVTCPYCDQPIGESDYK